MQVLIKYADYSVAENLKVFRNGTGIFLYRIFLLFIFFCLCGI